MATEKQTKGDIEAPEGTEDTEEVVEDGEEGGQAAGGEDVATIKLSRRKREQAAREERETALRADIDARRAESEALRRELQQTREQQARMAGALEEMQRRPVQQSREPSANDEPIERRLSKSMKAAQAALGKSDLDEYHDHITEVMRLQAQQIMDEREASRPKPPPVQAQQPQKPDWVRAIEFQYPDVLTHAAGQHTVGIFDNLLATSEQFGPQRLHKAFQRARQELGLVQQQAPAANNSARALHTGITSNGTPPRRAANGDSVVRIPETNLKEMLKAGLTKKQAAVAWRESYGDEG